MYIANVLYECVWRGSGRSEYLKFLLKLKNQYQIESIKPRTLAFEVDKEGRSWIHCILPYFMVKHQELIPPSFPKERRMMCTILLSLLPFMPWITSLVPNSLIDTFFYYCCYYLGIFGTQHGWLHPHKTWYDLGGDSGQKRTELSMDSW